MYVIRSAKIKKRSALLFSFILVLTLVSACSGGNKNGNASNPPASSQAADPSPSPSPSESASAEPTEDKADLGGRVIKMAANWDMTPNEETPEGVIKVEKQKAVEEKYNVKIEYITLSNEEYKDKMITSITNGNPVADMFFMGSPGAVPSLTKQGMFLALEDIDVLPPAEDNQVIPRDAFYNVAGHDGKTYAFGTDASVDKIGVYYNRKLFADNGLPDPHAWVDSKEWTWDKFRELAVQLTKDEDGDGTPDQWGSMTYAGDWLWFMILANGGQIMNKDTGKQMLDDPKSIEAMDYIYRLFNEDKVVRPGGWEFMGEFPKGKIALLPSFSWYGGTIKASEMGDGYGFLPMPLGPGQTEYVNPARQVNAFFMAKGVKDPEIVLKLWKELQIWEVAEGHSEYDKAQYAHEDDIAVAEMLASGTKNFDFFAGLHGGLIDEIGNKLASGEMTAAQAAQTYGPQLQAKFDGK